MKEMAIHRFDPYMSEVYKTLLPRIGSNRNTLVLLAVFVLSSSTRCFGTLQLLCNRFKGKMLFSSNLMKQSRCGLFV